MATVLFVCVHNAGRSQMSAALLERESGGRHRALSAGTKPGDAVHPAVVVVMRELGVDLANRRPRLLTHGLAERADLVVTMGCGDACPYIPGKRYVDWDLDDPEGKTLDEVRDIRDEVRAQVGRLVAELDARDARPRRGGRSCRGARKRHRARTAGWRHGAGPRALACASDGASRTGLSAQGDLL